MPSIDVIIPTRNRPDLTREAVTSVVAQTHVDWRLIIVDDGSEPDAVQALQRIVATDERLLLVERKVPGGPQAARQTGYENSIAKYIATLDSDDLWRPDKLAAQWAVFQTSPLEDLGAVLTWHAWVRAGEVVRQGTPAVSGRARPLLTDNMSTPLIARWALERAGGFLPPTMRLPAPGDGASHIEFWIRLTQYCSLAVVEDVLVECRAHTGDRASDALRSTAGADNLAFVERLHRIRLAEYASDHALLLARIGARYLSVGARREGLSYLRRALGAAPTRDVVAIIKRYGPHTVRALLRKSSS